MTSPSRAAALRSWIFSRDPALLGSFAIHPPGGCWGCTACVPLLSYKDVKEGGAIWTTVDFSRRHHSLAILEVGRILAGFW